MLCQIVPQGRGAATSDASCLNGLLQRSWTGDSATIMMLITVAAEATNSNEGGKKRNKTRERKKLRFASMLLQGLSEREAKPSIIIATTSKILILIVLAVTTITIVKAVMAVRTVNWNSRHEPRERNHTFHFVTTKNTKKSPGKSESTKSPKPLPQNRTLIRTLNPKP